MDALEADADAIRDLAPRICLEIGRVRRCPPTPPTTSHLFAPSNVFFFSSTNIFSRSGTGIVSTFLGQIVGASNARPYSLLFFVPSCVQTKMTHNPDSSSHPQVFLCTDINPHAATCTARTASQNKVQHSDPPITIHHLTFPPSQNE